MKTLLNKLMADTSNRKWWAIGITLVISGVFTLWGIYGINEYGIALFCLIPLFMGASAAMILGYKNPITKTEAWAAGIFTLVVFSACLLIFAIEGLICIFMAAPIAFVLNSVGSLIGYAIISKTPKRSLSIWLLLMGSIPSVAFIEKNQKPELNSVITSVDIDADPATVWENVIEFPQLSEPSEFLFKTGIAYPTNAKIEGSGVGAVRHCNFTTGSFTEPVTVWDKPQLLAFDVEEQPAPMKELSFWDIDAPHLHDYFVSTKGQFKLIALPNGKTRLEGTTWYYHDIKPAIYWKFWSEYIIHKIHYRVLEHIKTNSEKARK